MNAEKPTTPEELRAMLGMKPGQLLTNSNGEMADILSINSDGTVTLGVLSRRDPVTVALSSIVPRDPANKG